MPTPISLPSPRCGGPTSVEVERWPWPPCLRSETEALSGSLGGDTCSGGSCCGDGPTEALSGARASTAADSGGSGRGCSTLYRFWTQ